MILFQPPLVSVLSLLVTLFYLSVQVLPVTCNDMMRLRSPCAEVADLVSLWNLTTVPAELAYECLSSVPLHIAEAQELHRSLLPYLKWQTTLTYVKNPPEGYQMPAFDFWSAFDNIGTKLSNAAYMNEWEFGMDLLRTFNSVHDGHFRYMMDVVGKVFSFGRDVALVSVSLDGQTLPRVYVHDDIQQWFRNNVSCPAAVVAINGQPVDMFLDNWMRVSWHQDPDALYNALFWSAAQNTVKPGSSTGLFAGSGFAQFFYPGPYTDIVFANGTTTTYQNFADVNVNFTGVYDGESFYQKFCADESQSTTTTTTETAPPGSSSTASDLTAAHPTTPGYPLPIIRHPQNFIAGYYLDSPSYDQVAILSISNFVSSFDEIDNIDFQRISQEFIRLAKAANKTKLIIDLRGNPGGTVLQAFDLFKQLFPHLEPWGGSRFRASDSFNAIGEQFSLASDAFHNGTNTTPESLSNVVQDPFNYQVPLDSSHHSFASWSVLYGPIHSASGDNFTHLLRLNFSSPLLTAGLGINVTGYQSPGNIGPQPFKNEEIILLQDGICSSTCATFSDLLRTQGSIKSIVLGGRPILQPMQAVGGTRGVEIYEFPYIYDLMKSTWHSGSRQQQEEWNRSAPDLARVSREPLRRSWKTGGVNGRDSILEEEFRAAGGVGGTPSQFLYVPADCRLWYTAEMVEDVRAVWEKVGDVAWGGEARKGSCVVGGL